MMLTPKTKILIVDDMKTMRMFVRKHLTSLGFENVQEADDGATAFPALEQAHASGEPFEIVLSDWSMPKVSGLDLLKMVRASQKFCKLPVIFITAESDKAQIVEALKAGVTGYVMKPFTAETLKEKLATIDMAQLKKAG